MASSCIIDDCGKPVVGHKMCQAHYTRNRRYGDPRAMRRATPVKNGPKVCIFDGCGAPSKSKGYCQKHYLRHRQHGDASIKLRAANGECMDWMRRHVDYTGEACLIWPYSTGGRGDPTVEYDGKMRSACRVMCALVNGHPPTPKHEAAHNCGKGHEGCINPSHLRWATSVENKADKRVHGTHTFGEIHPVSKLTEPEVMRVIRGSDAPCALARELGVSHTLIIRIRRGDLWKHIDRSASQWT